LQHRRCGHGLHSPADSQTPSLAASTLPVSGRME
jgi:hypothetical protein